MTCKGHTFLLYREKREQEPGRADMRRNRGGSSAVRRTAGHHAEQKAAGFGAALAHGTRGGFLRHLGLLSGTAHRLGRGQGKTPMQPCTQPGYHAMQKAAGLVAALAHGTRGGFLRCLGLLSGTAYRLRWTRGGPDAVRRTAGHHAGQRKIPRHRQGIVSVIRAQGIKGTGCR